MKKLRILLILTSILFSKFSFADVEKINNEQLKNLIGSKAIPLIDIRTPKEWLETGVIKGSHLITFFDENGKFNLDEWLPKLEKIVDKKDPFILICRSGRRSSLVAMFLDKELSYEEVFDATDGMREWKKANNLTVHPKL